MITSTKKPAMESATDVLSVGEPGSIRDRFNAILAQIDLIPETVNPNEPLEWDEHGFPK